MRSIPDHPNLRTHEHPLIAHKMRILRDAETSPQTFRRVLGEIAGLMTYEALRDLPTTTCRVRTPIAECDAVRLAAPITIVPILRAGLGMTDGILGLVPEARIGHIGVQRDENTKRPVEYYEKLPPDVADGPVLVVDPMLATGGSGAHAVAYLKDRGCRQIRFLCLVAAPEGVAHLQESHPNVPVHAAVLDERLDDRAYIVPGLGDAGDRTFGTL
ncbi:MAG: uracil phosphoribosyltransferase [Planctomycetota bacterium]|nr:uracil phosphoribosyltransferase [Planctomycetota bacterium]